MPEFTYDVIIAGGGPAGLSAALVLARCRRRILLCDTGKQRNRVSAEMHGYLTRDGIAPSEFIRLAYEEVSGYGVEICRVAVRNARQIDGGFEVALENGSVHAGRKMLLATGMVDQLPKLGNIERFYGKSVHHCPYCDGWENRDKRVAIYSKKPGLAFSLKTWTTDVMLFTDGPARFSTPDRQKLERYRIPVYRQKIAGLEGDGGQMERIVFENGTSVERDAMFFSTGQIQACSLAEELGCALNQKGTIDTNRMEMTGIPGLFAAGDVSRDVQMVIVAAAEGAKAAFAINVSLQQKEIP